nr:hypothetical protein [Tanacetum cinerariifolium]
FFDGCSFFIFYVSENNVRLVFFLGSVDSATSFVALRLGFQCLVDICVVLLPMSVGVVVCGLVVADVVVVESLSSGMSVKTVGPRIASRMNSGFLILLPGELKVMICAFKKDGNSCVSLFSSPLATSLQSATILWAFGLKHVNDTVFIPSSMNALKQ